MGNYSEGLLRAWLPGLPSERIRRIEGGVDGERFHPAPERAETRRRLGLPSEAPSCPRCSR